MDYKELTADLLSSCDENCAFCKYADIDCECNIAEKAATAINDLLARAEAAEAMAEKAERERDKAIEAICTHCMDFPCQEDDCKWWRGQKEE